MQDISRISTGLVELEQAPANLPARSIRGGPIRIGIDALAWNDNTGYGRFCREIVSALLRIPIRYSFTLLLEPDTNPPAGVEVVRCPRGRHAGSAMRTVPQLLGQAWTIARIPTDLWFFPSPLHFVPVLARVPVLVAVHDTMPFSYPRLIFPSLARRLAWRMKLRLAVQQASHLITVSHHARTSIARHFHLAESSISIVGEAPAAIFRPREDSAALAAISERLGIPAGARMVIYHGALAPHKNLRMLARVFAKLCLEPTFTDVYLVLAGSQDGSSREEFHALQSICLGLDRVKFAGVLDDYDLTLALNRATLAVLPSLEEGFGLTGLEAAACGTPLIATRSSALPQVLCDAAVYFEPRDENALYEQLAGLLADVDRRNTLRERGIERAAALSWESSAMRLMEIFEAVLARPGSARGFNARTR